MWKPALHEIPTPALVAMLVGLVLFSVIGGVLVATVIHKPDDKKIK